MTLDLRRIASLAEALLDATLTFKTQVALIEADRHRESLRLTYRQMRAEAERVGARLQSAGLGPDDRCAILMSNQARWVISGLSVLWSGAVLVPLDYKLSAKEQVALLEHCRPKALVTEYGIYRALVAAGFRVPSELCVLVTEAPADAELGTALRFEQPALTTFRFVPRARTDLASIVYSSGTGGTPRVAC